MITAKAHVRAALRKLPADYSMNDILYHLYVSDKVERGLRDAAAGRMVSQAKIEEEYRRWKATKSRGRKRRAKI